MWALTLRAFLYSLAMHAVVIALLIVNFDYVRQPVIKPGAKENIIEAVTVDDKAVERELQRLKNLEKEKQQALENKLKAIEKKASETEKKRKAEEQRLAEAKRKAAADEKKRAQARIAEEKRAALERERIKAEKQKAEADLKRIEEEKRKAEAERKRIEEEKRRAEAERKRIEEEKRKAEAERKRIEEEKRKAKAERERIKAEEREREEAQRLQDQKTLQIIGAEIYRKVTSNFNKTGLPKGLKCKLSVQAIPGGEVINVTLSASSGNEIFDRRAIVAVEKASPLPLPADPVTLDRLKLRKFILTFEPKD